MTNQEFIDNLSPKAKTILNGQYTRRTNKSIEINLHEKYTRVITDNPIKYIIYVQHKEIMYDMEYSLLHEFLHCIQTEEGFPSTNFLDKKYQKISADISTVVLDQDVYHKLSQLDYENPSYFKNTYNEFEQLVLSVSKSKNSILLANQIEQRIWFSCKLILLQMVFGEGSLKNLTNTIKQKMPLVYKTYNIMNTAIQTHGFSTPEEVTNSFKAIIQGLGLEKYIIIVN